MYQNYNKTEYCIPVAILEDASGSTAQMADVMNEQMRLMISALKQNRYADQVRLTAVHFDEIRQKRAFSEPLHEVRDSVLDLIDPVGATDTGAALLEILDTLERDRETWEQSGMQCAEPILLMLTDGLPSPGKSASDAVRRAYETRYRNAAERIKAMEKAGRLRFAAVGIKQTAIYQADINVLKKLTEYPNERVFQAEVRYWDELDLSGPIRWLGDAVTEAGKTLNRSPAAPKVPSRPKKEAAEAEHSDRCELIRMDDITKTFFGLKGGNV